MKSRFILDSRYAEALEYLGMSIREVLKKAELPEDLFSHKFPSMAADEFTRFMEAIKTLSPDPNLPIKMGSFENIETFSPPIFAAYCSKNALACMKRLSRYKRLIGPLVFIVNEHKDTITLELCFEEEGKELPEYLVAMELVFLTQLIRNATKVKIIPQEVLTSYPLNQEAYRDFFGVMPKRGVKNQLTLSKADATLPFISQNDSMWAYFEPELKRRLSELEIDDTYAARVRSVLIELLPSGEGSVEDVAKKLGCSKRTLQRKLKEEETSFQKQLNHTRELLARHYLKNSDLTSESIAYLLGYQDLNSFVRAFQLWTGMTLSEYKKQ